MANVLKIREDINSPWQEVSALVGPMGPQGAPGADGQDGYSPVKGTDYWTEEDKQEIVNDVLAALPIYNGEVV